MIHISTEATIYTTSRIYASYLQGLPIYTWSRKWNPLQYSYLQISMDRGAWRAANSQTWWSNWAHTPIHTTNFSPSIENEDFKISQCKIFSFSPIQPTKQNYQPLRGFLNTISEIFVIGLDMLRWYVSFVLFE